MAGRKPAFSLAANRKDDPKGGKRKYMDIGAAWPNSFGGFNFSLAKGVKVKLADGTVLNGDDFWFTLFDKREKDGADGDEWGEPGSKAKEWDGKDDPFALPQTKKAAPTAEEMDQELDDIFGGRKLTGSGQPLDKPEPVAEGDDHSS